MAIGFGRISAMFVSGTFDAITKTGTEQARGETVLRSCGVGGCLASKVGIADSVAIFVKSTLKVVNARIKGRVNTSVF